jgi:hypothetical protein
MKGGKAVDLFYPPSRWDEDPNKLFGILNKGDLDEISAKIKKYIKALQQSKTKSGKTPAKYGGSVDYEARFMKSSEPGIVFGNLGKVLKLYTADADRTTGEILGHRPGIYIDGDEKVTYTAAAGGIRLAFYQLINRTIYGGIKTILPVDLKHKMLNALMHIQQYSTCTGAATKIEDELFYVPFAAVGSENLVYRAICNDYDNLDANDTQFILTTITSTSVSETRARTFFTMPDCVGPKLLLKIDISSVKDNGIYVKKYSYFDEEEEILLPIGTILRTTEEPVTRCTCHPGGHPTCPQRIKIIKCRAEDMQPVLDIWKVPWEKWGGVSWTRESNFYMYFPIGATKAEVPLPLAEVLQEAPGIWPAGVLVEGGAGWMVGDEVPMSVAVPVAVDEGPLAVGTLLPQHPVPEWGILYKMWKELAKEKLVAGASLAAAPVTWEMEGGRTHAKTKKHRKKSHKKHRKKSHKKHRKKSHKKHRKKSHKKSHKK